MKNTEGWKPGAKTNIVVCVMVLLMLFFVVKGKRASDDYNEKMKNQTSVIATVTKVDERIRREEEYDDFLGRDVTYETTYYWIETTYEYNNREYDYNFEKDDIKETTYKNGKKQIVDSYYVGQGLPISIDSTDPEYVFESNPGHVYWIIASIIGAIIGGIFLLFIMSRFCPQFILPLPFFIGTVACLCAGIVSKEFLGFLGGLIMALIYGGVAFIFYAFSKKPPETDKIK